jgi:hypothetical protein
MYNETMKKFLIVLLAALLFVLLTVTGVLLYLFSDTGNATLKPYLQQKLAQEIGMPVKVNSYRLRAGSSRLDVVINDRMRIRVVSRFSLWKRSFEGLYHIVAHDFEYQGAKLRQANIKGHFKGVPENIFVDGNGTALDAPVNYRLRVKEESLRQIEATMQGLSLAEVLALSKQPPLAQGRVNIEIDMPRIGEEGAKGTAHLRLSKATFNAPLIRKLYGYDLPDNSPINAKAEARLEGKKITFGADAKSALFLLGLKKGILDLDAKKLQSQYRLDIRELRVLTQNKLAGALTLTGALRAKGKVVYLTGMSRSLGGELHFEKGKKTTVTLQDLSVAKLLRMLRQPNYLEGKLGGKLTINDAALQKGSYLLQVTEGRVNARVIGQRFGYTVPDNTQITFRSEGRISGGMVHAKSELHSSLADATLSSMQYDMKTKRLSTQYRVTIPNPQRLLQKQSRAKGMPLAIKGKLDYQNTIALEGNIKGLGKRIHFAYDGIRAELDAVAMQVGKALALAGLPVYVTGGADLQLKLSNVKALNGTFVLKSSRLTTRPESMRKLIGKPLKMHLSLNARGKMTKGSAYGKANVQSDLGTLNLSKFNAGIKTGTFNAAYTLKIPDLTKLYLLTGSKLYGSILTSGTISKTKYLKINGTTRSLGGNVNYTLVDDRFSTKVSAVPLPNILKLQGFSPDFLGTASGKAAYNLKSRIGKADLTIASFQIKSSTLTNTLKTVLGKDPARIIFKTTTFHADIKKDIVTYTLHAKGGYSAFDLTSGWLNMKTKAIRAKFKFVYGKYTIYGKIKGTTEHPKVMLDTKAIIKDKLKKKVKEKLQKKLQKALGGQAGALLRGLGL